MRQHARARARVDADVVRRLTREVGVCPLHVELGMIADPRVIEGGVVWNEVQHELDAAVGQPLAKPLERPRSTELAVDDVVADCER